MQKMGKRKNSRQRGEAALVSAVPFSIDFAGTCKVFPFHPPQADEMGIFLPLDLLGAPFSTNKKRHHAGRRSQNYVDCASHSDPMELCSFQGAW